MLQRSPNTRLVARRQAFPRRHRSRPYHQNGEQVAVIRALNGARLHLGLPIPAPTLSEAARMAGTHVGYVQAAIAVLRAEDADSHRGGSDGRDRTAQSGRAS